VALGIDFAHRPSIFFSQMELVARIFLQHENIQIITMHWCSLVWFVAFVFHPVFYLGFRPATNEPIIVISRWCLTLLKITGAGLQL
jgi:hypothetical protein